MAPAPARLSPASFRRGGPRGPPSAVTARVADYLTTTRAETTEGLTLSWRLNHASLAEDARFDGIYCLLTNDTAPDASAHRLDPDYKGQPKVEDRLHVVDSLSIQVRPLWLRQPKRSARDRKVNPGQQCCPFG